MKVHKLVVLALGLVLSSPIVGAYAQSSESRYDKEIQKTAQEQMQKRDKHRNVTATAEDGIVTLGGEVELFIDKMNAEKQVKKIKNVDGVRNHITVVSNVHDDVLREQLSDKLRYDRIGYGIQFNSLTLHVDRGVVTLGGNVRDYPDRDSAIAIVETTPGVKDVIDDINVAPLSAVDDDLRIRLANAIYGHVALQKYANDPQAPIRIVVENGHVELHGYVLNAGDKQVAYSQASSVPGVFSVTNNLVVAIKGRG
jgi:hyperosmotically inducible protein